MDESYPQLLFQAKCPPPHPEPLPQTDSGLAAHQPHQVDFEELERVMGRQSTRSPYRATWAFLAGAALMGLIWAMS